MFFSLFLLDNFICYESLIGVLNRVRRTSVILITTECYAVQHIQKQTKNILNRGSAPGVPVLHGSTFDYIYARIYNINSSLELVGFREGV